MSTNRHPIEPEELMAYLDGELSADQATEALSHLELCPECQSLAADFRGVSQELLAWEVE
jgi:anti-sigma factor RsiW